MVPFILLINLHPFCFLCFVLQTIQPTITNETRPLPDMFGFTPWDFMKMPSALMLFIPFVPFWTSSVLISQFPFILRVIIQA